MQHSKLRRTLASDPQFYAPGVGLVLEVDLQDGTRSELVGVSF